jgi:hypothetical protein
MMNAVMLRFAILEVAKMHADSRFVEIIPDVILKGMFHNVLASQDTQEIL